ncbi:TolC family protein, partial [Prochlorococcus marinus]
MKSFIFIKLIILSSLFINVRSEQKPTQVEQNNKHENPYLSKSKELKEISYENLRDLLVNNNLEYAAAIERFNQAAYDLKATLKLKYPTIDLQSNGLPSYLIGDEYRNPRYNAATDFETNQLETSLSTLIKWDIIDPERKPEIAIKRLGVDKAKNALKMIIEDLNLKAQSQYYQLQTARAKINTSKIMVNSSKKSLESTIIKNKAMLAPRLEVFEAETQLLRDKVLLNNFYRDEAEAIRLLSNTLGLSDNYLAITNDQISIKGLWNNSLEKTKKNAILYNQKLKELDLEIKLADKQIKKSNALIKPKFSIVNTLSGSYKFGQEEVSPPVENNDYRRNFNNTIALTSQWRIFDAGRSKELKQKNISRKKEFKAKYKKENTRIFENLENAFTKLSSAKQNILNSYIQVIKQKEILNISYKRFEAGVTNQREIINNQRDLLFARNSFIDAVSFYNNNLISLKRISGDLKITPCSNNFDQIGDVSNLDIVSDIQYELCEIDFQEFNKFEMNTNKFNNEEIKSEKLIEEKKDTKKINEIKDVKDINKSEEKSSNETLKSDRISEEEKEIIEFKNESSDNSSGFFKFLKRFLPWGKEVNRDINELNSKGVKVKEVKEVKEE